jgi:hypothetical protein
VSALTASALVVLPRRLPEKMTPGDYASQAVKRIETLMYQEDKPLHVAKESVGDPSVTVEWSDHVLFASGSRILRVNVPLDLDKLSDAKYCQERTESARNVALPVIEAWFEGDNNDREEV